MKRIWIIIFAILALINLYLFTELESIRHRLDQSNENLIIHNTINEYTTEITNAVKSIDQIIVKITTATSYGSGFIYDYHDGDAYILTNAHVIANSGDYIGVEFDNFRSLPAQAIAVDEINDIALLLVKPDFEVLKADLGDSSRLTTGEFVIAAGSSKEARYASSLTLGIVSDKYRQVSYSLNARNYVLTMIQSDVEIDEGYSGGPLINIGGEVIGMNTMKVRDETNKTLSIPINQIKNIVSKMLEGSEIKRTELGIKVVGLNDLETYQRSSLNIEANVVSGVYVYNIDSHSLGSQIGLARGDIIQSINGLAITNIEDYQKAIYGEGDMLSIVVIRSGQEMVLESADND